MKKIITIFALCIFFISFANAAEWDNVMTYDELTETITFTNILGFGQDLAQAQLIFNGCDDGRYCEALKDIILYEEGALIQDFKTLRLDDGSEDEQNIRGHTLEYWGEIIDYGIECRNGETLFDEVNQTYYAERICEEVVDGSHEGWVKFQEGDIFQEGTYQVKTSGEIRPGRVYDWQVKIKGDWTTPWATWGNITDGDDAEVILNAPAEGETAVESLITFNASANITGGSTLVNLSLYTNETGTWAIRNTTILGANITKAHGVDIDSDAGQTDFYGMQINYALSEQYYISSVVAETQAGCDFTRIYFQNGTLITTSGISDASTGGTMTFENNYSLNADQIYRVECNTPGGDRRFSSDSFPVEIGGLTWIGGSNNGINDTSWNNLVSINVSSPVTTFITETWNRTITDGINWSVQGCDSDGDCGFAPQNRTLLFDIAAPLIEVQSPVGTIDLGVINGTERLNVTFIDSNLQSCIFDYNGTNVTIEGCVNGVKNSTTFILELDNQNMTIYANDTTGNANLTEISWEYTILEINQTFSNQTTEGAAENFSAVIRVLSGETISAVALIYNNTINAGETVALGNETEIRIENFIIPNVGPDTNITFNWSIFLASGTVINLTSQTQEVGNLSIDNCSTFTTQILNLTMVDEELQTNLVNTTIEIAVELLSVDRSEVLVNFSGEFTDENPLGICLNVNVSAGVEYSLDAVIRYQAEGYAIENYNLVRASVTNSTGIQNITLFDLNETDSTEFQLTFKGLDFLPEENVLIFVERQYISESAFKTVELPKTDSNGQTVLHLVRNDVIYNLRAVKDSVVLSTLSNIIAFCDDFTIGSCTISFNALTNETSIPNYDEDVGIIYEDSPTYNATTNRVSFSFTSSDGTAKNILMNVQRRDVFGNLTVCENVLISTSGTVSCDIGLDLSDTSLYTTISIEGTEWITSNVIIDTTTFGNIGYAMWFILSIALALMFTESKNGIMLSILFSYIAGIGLGWGIGGIAGAGSAGIFVIIMTVIGIWKINKNRLT